MGVQFSFVRSLSMDAWTEKQLKLMTIGGNKNIYEFLQVYDLNEEGADCKYKARACEYYREQVSFKQYSLISPLIE